MSKKPRAEGGGRHATLTANHRQYLSGIIDKEGNTESKTREAIRERIEESLFDFMLLFYYFGEEDIRRTFEEHASSEEGPIQYRAPKRSYGMIGTGYEDKLGYPREGDHNTGYDGDSMHKAAIKQLLRENRAIDESPSEDANVNELLAATESKASVSTQQALVHSVAFLCRIAEAGQLDIRDVIEQGVEKYHRQYNQRDVIPALRQTHPESVPNRMLEKDLLPGELRGIERRDMWEEAKQRTEVIREESNNNSS